MPERKMNSWLPISSTLFRNNSCAMIKKMQKASNTIFRRAVLDLDLNRPKREIEEKKIPVKVAISVVFHSTDRILSFTIYCRPAAIPIGNVLVGIQ